MANNRVLLKLFVREIGKRKIGETIYITKVMFLAYSPLIRELSDNNEELLLFVKSSPKNYTISLSYKR